ncbi:MAG: hypothetical protein CVU90_08870 [Firmicutes bacterium HGW-Firmicutes-15]|nr:MAG: hypothetical protein CVU90_08870 [Firmicutes bacterium HGW-Firmicutes-15]
MNNDDLIRKLKESDATIENLRDELAQTHSGLLALTLELEQRVDERTAQLQARAHQQAVVAIVGQKALANSNLNELMNETVISVLHTLEVEYCIILACSDDKDILEIKAGVCQEGTEMDTLLSINSSNQYTKLTRFYNKSVVFESLQNETDFKIPEILNNRGIISGMSALISGADQALGFLEIYSNEKHVFTSDDIHFMESIANVLAGAIERKQTEDHLKYYSMHDSLTNLYNRTYFEEEMNRLINGRLNSVGIIMCDIDGLKLINDTLGHNYGDRLLSATADILRESFRSCDVIARIGGDEFVILLPNVNESILESFSRRIRTVIDNYNIANPELPLSLSIGFAVDPNGSNKMNGLLKEADDKMYRQKLQHRQSSRSAIVHTLMEALAERDFITQGHADRLRHLVREVAIAIGLPENKIGDLQLLAQFHDIGKVGIPDSILFKPTFLVPEEIIEIQRHSEIGYRIAMAAPDLVPVADWILKHHEWWNGQGYPLGLKGEEIPMECRILAIADAYDAMTNHRPYRQALFTYEVIAELEKCAGHQFDPELVPKFLEVLHNKEIILK